MGDEEIPQGNSDELKKMRDGFLRCSVLNLCSQSWKDFLQAIQNRDPEGINESPIIQMLNKMLIGRHKDLFAHDLNEGKKLFRARLVSQEAISKSKDIPNNGIFYDEQDKRLNGFSKNYSGAPSLNVSSNGRCNIAGVSYLYLAEDIQTACHEVKPNPGDIASVATYRLNHSLRLLDVSFAQKEEELSVIFQDACIDYITIELIKRSFMVPVRNDEEYAASQVLSDMVRREGFDGIVYISNFTRKKNYILFNDSPRYIEFQTW